MSLFFVFFYVINTFSFTWNLPIIVTVQRCIS